MKTNFTEQQLQQIKDLFNQDYGSRKIANIMGVNRSTIIRAYKQLELDSASKKTPRFAFKATEKCCKICNLTKDINQFRKRIREDRISFEVYCLDCEKEYQKISNKKRYEDKWDERKEYREKNKDKIKKYLKQYIPQYRKNRMQIDPEFKIRCTVSTSIYIGLKKENAYKSEGGCWKYMSYGPQDLRNHLECLFEPWMNWDNWGMYITSLWDDNDPSTWTWQIDHIIPQSDLPYTSMEDENFKKCWALSNLRPYSAKQNNLDGVNKTRHNK